MSAEYPVLDNRPINKWKVTELKEELKRRNLTVRGLKDDLVKRLDEAIRIERAATEAQEATGFEGGVGGNFGDTKINASVHLDNEALEHDGKEVNQGNEVLTGMNIDCGITESDQGKALEQESAIDNDLISMIDEPAVTSASLDLSNVQDEVVMPQVFSSEGVLENEKLGKDDELFGSSKKDALEALGVSSGEVLDSKVPPHMENLEDNEKIDNKEVEGLVLNLEKAIEDNEVKPENKSLESSQMDADHNKAHSSNQVYEVSPNLGFKIECESFSTDTLTNNEKEELKDNLNADNAQLESGNVRQEMVQPSTSTAHPDDFSVHPLDDLMPLGNQRLDGEFDDDKPKNVEISEKNDNEDKFSVDILVRGHDLENQATEKVHNVDELNQMNSAKDTSLVSGLSSEKTEPSVEEKMNLVASGMERNPQDVNDFNKTTGMMDGELLEKVNIDQSSADEMEEDSLDTKLDSDYNSSKLDEKTESGQQPGVGEGSKADVLHHVSSDDKLESLNDQKDSLAAPTEKRKFQDAPESGSREPLKRQRRWNVEGQKEPEFQSSGASLATKPKPSLETASVRPNLSVSSSAPSRETAKKREVPPSQKAPTTSLRIENFVRPFTLKAVHQLLQKTGNVCDFWMNDIKSHCFVTYSSVDEAIDTRNAVYNLQWPPNGERCLIAEFVDPAEVKSKLVAPSQSAGPSANSNTSAVIPQPLAQPVPPTSQQLHRQLQEAQHPLSRLPPVRGPSMKIGQLPRVPSPEKVDTTLPTLDGLFRKTKATPRIYYLPLTDEEVAAKVSRQKMNRQ